MLTYEDIKEILPATKGLEGADILFECIAFQSSTPQQKGLFVFSKADGNLQQAIANGAIAVVWPDDTELPFYTPNHFPVFLADDLLNSVIQLTERFKRKLSVGETNNKTMMNLPPATESIIPIETLNILRELLQPTRESDKGKESDPK